MKRVLQAIALTFTLVSPMAAHAAEAAAPAGVVVGSAEAGSTKATPCVACHGVGGNGVINPLWPKLAAQHARYIALQLKHFKSGERTISATAGQPANAMALQAANLSEQDMADIAAFFSIQRQVPGLADKSSLKIGNKLYRTGDATRGIPACASCHGPKGSGNPTAGYPRLGGQNAPYTVNQLNSFRKGKDGERGGSKNALIMSTITAKLTDEEIAALASYINGLQ